MLRMHGHGIQSGQIRVRKAKLKKISDISKEIHQFFAKKYLNASVSKFDFFCGKSKSKTEKWEYLNN